MAFRFRTIGLVLAGFLGATAPVGAQQSESPAAERERYEDCILTARRIPAEALEEALAWARESGAMPARHCLALAFAGLGEYDKAGAGLETLAGEAGPLATRIALWRQAGNVWLAADKPDRALAAFEKASGLAPEDPDLMVEQARARAAAGDLWGAVDDLGRALERAPDAVEALVLRAAAYRRLDVPELSGDDLARALGLAPKRADAYLERGLLKQDRGDQAGARADFAKVIELAPDSPAAKLARTHMGSRDSGG